MRGKNYGICHSCRQAGHWLEDCPTKRRCPRCGDGFVRLFEVEKPTSNYVGELFYCCSRWGCRYFEWLKEEGSSSDGKTIDAETTSVDDLSRILETCARISNEDNKVDINVITFRHRNTSGNGNGNGKGKEKVKE